MTVNHDLDSVLKENASGYLTSFEYKKTRIAAKRGIATPATTGKKTNVFGNASPQCPLGSAPWSILMHRCYSGCFSTNLKKMLLRIKYKNYVYTSRWLCRCSHLSSQLWIELQLSELQPNLRQTERPTLLSINMILHAPTITPKPPAGSCCSENGFTEWTFHCMQKTWGSLGFAALLRWNC